CTMASSKWSSVEMDRPGLQASADRGKGLVKRILIVLAAMASVPPLAQAQSDDKAYCAELSGLYRKYVQNATGRRYDGELLVALVVIWRGITASAIPVHEKRLRDAKIAPPGGGEFKP